MNEQENKIRNSLQEALCALSEAAKLENGAQIVVGCSTSEIVGGRIGKQSVPELGELIAETVIGFASDHGFIPVFQCCEHLNRSLVIPLSAAKANRYTLVRAIPQPKAGGSVAAAAWKRLAEPALVSSVQADAGLDIGDTLIGMHIRPVAVPFRCNVKRIGEANLVLAYSRLPYIGGSRAVYEEQV